MRKSSALPTIDWKHVLGSVFVALLIVKLIFFRVSGLQAASHYDGQPVISPNGQQIAFVSDRDGSKDIWIMSRDGTGKYNLTPALEGSDEYFPQWSYDGKYVAFVALTGQREIDIWFASLSDSALVNLTASSREDVGYSLWAPESYRLVFEEGDLTSSQIWLIDAITREFRQITQDGINSSPTWSSDGQRIHYLSRASSQDRLVTVDLSSGEESVDASGDIISYAFSPVSSKLAVLLRRANDLLVKDIAIYEAGKPQHTVLTGQYDLILLSDLQWSPDEDQILFVVECGSSSAILALSVADGSINSITGCQNGHNAFPSWSPDGNSVVFQSERDGTYAIWMMAVDGSSATNLSVSQG